MKINIIKGQDRNLKIPKFVCDKPLNTDVPSPYHLMVDGFKFILFVGRPASGKTSHMISLFKDKQCLRTVWNNVTLTMPKTSLNSLREGDNIFKDNEWRVIRKINSGIIYVFFSKVNPRPIASQTPQKSHHPFLQFHPKAR